MKPRVAIACQGGGSQTAFTAGVLKALFDVRHPQELAVESVPGAVNIPLDELRGRLDELPRDREILVFCRSDQRAHAKKFSQSFPRHLFNNGPR